MLRKNFKKHWKKIVLTAGLAIIVLAWQHWAGGQWNWTSAGYFIIGLYCYGVAVYMWISAKRYPESKKDFFWAFRLYLLAGTCSVLGSLSRFLFRWLWTNEVMGSNDYFPMMLILFFASVVLLVYLFPEKQKHGNFILVIVQMAILVTAVIVFFCVRLSGIDPTNYPIYGAGGIVIILEIWNRLRNRRIATSEKNNSSHL